MPPRKTDETNPADWFLLGAERPRPADVLAAAEGATPPGIELLQEAVERFLKGCLIAKGRRLKRTHDLELLLSEAEAFDAGFARFTDFAEHHYPGGSFDETPPACVPLREQAGELLALIRSLLPESLATLAP